MKVAGIGLALLLAAGLTGCVTHPVDNYSDLPGSGDHMAKGPGLFAGDQKDSYDGGYEVYSVDLSKAGKKGASSEGASAKDAPTQATSTDKQSFKQFKEFQDYQRFENMPKDSADYREFKKWQQWQQYKQWKAQQSK